MARSIFSQQLRHRSNRLKLPIRKKPYKILIAPNIFLAYRRNEGPGTWSVQAGWLRRFALADDFEAANGKSVMTFWQAQRAALAMVRGGDGEDDKPATVDEALTAYRIDLQARGAIVYNESTVRRHISANMLSKTVALLTEQELTAWQTGLLAKVKPASAYRMSKSLKAALRLAARRDRRITNSAAWTNGLRALKVKGANRPPRDNYYLPDTAILAIRRECYVEDQDFGAIIDVMSETGARESQILKLWPADLKDCDTEKPRLMMPRSDKGRGPRDSERRALSITPRLAKILQARRMARGANRPLFDRVWNMSKRFRVVLVRLKLDVSLSPYALRHTSIIRQIYANVPLRVVAFAHDTSIAEIERTYGRYLSAGSDLTRRALIEAEPAVDNVIKLAR